MRPFQALSGSQAFVNRAFADGFAYHGDVGLRAESYESYLQRIVEGHLGKDAAEQTRLELLTALHTNDLYLSISCAESSEAAWRRFDALYRRYLTKVASFVCGSGDAGEDIAARVIADLFLSDRSGEPRIASFDGRVPLVAWLRAIVTYRAFKESKRWRSNAESIDSELADGTAIAKIDAQMRAHRYEAVLIEALRGASQLLTGRERTILLMRYEEELQAKEIARIFAVSPSTITRTLQAIREKLREEVISILSCKYKLSPPVIDECIEDILENPRYSILAFVRRFENT